MMMAITMTMTLVMVIMMTNQLSKEDKRRPINSFLLAILEEQFVYGKLSDRHSLSLSRFRSHKDEQNEERKNKKIIIIKVKFRGLFCISCSSGCYDFAKFVDGLAC